MTERTETRHGEGVGSQEDLAAGEAAAIVPQIPRRREDADPDLITELWANAKAAWTVRDFPKYGSREWIALAPDDPRRLAAALEAAELWRKYGDEDELIAWFRSAFRSRPSLAERRTRAELDAAAKPKRPRQLQATPSWPPIRVPGRPGRYLRCEARREAA